MRRLSLAAASVVLIFWSGPAVATPFTLDHLLGLERFGQAVLSPSESAVAFERVAPQDGSPPYEYDALDRVLRTRVYIAPTDGGAPRPLLGQAEGRGHVIGSWSPDDRRVLIYRLRDRAFTAGVADAATGEVRWLAGTAEVSMWGRAAQWRNRDDLVMIQRPDDDLPGLLRQGFNAEDRMSRLWRATREGEQPGRTVIGGGRFLDLNPRAAETRLMLISAGSGRQRTLATGRFHDLEIAPDGRFVAAARFTGDRPFDPNLPFLQGDFTERRELTLVDLETEEIWEPLPGQDVSPLLLTWSASGRLLVWVRNDGEAWADGRLMQIDPAAKTVRETPLAGLKPAVMETGLRMPFVSADWLGDTPLLYVDDGARRDWAALPDTGPDVLTARFSDVGASRYSVSTDRIAIQADGQTLSVGRDGVTVGLGRSIRARSSVTGVLFSQGQRFQFNSPPRRDWVLAGDDTATWRVALHSGEKIDASQSTQSPLLAAGARHVVGVRTDAAFREALHLDDRPALVRLNDPLEGVDFVSPQAIHHRAADGTPLVSWLYRPRFQGAHRPALIVIPYPGAPAYAPGPTEENVVTNVQLMTAAGYAVLIPSLPRENRRGEPAAGMASDILTVVDEAAQSGDFDPDRIVLWGHSFGAFAAVAAATQSDRFSAVIAPNGPYDLLSVWGQFPMTHSLSPEDGLPVRSRAGWVETGQGGLDSPPYADVDRFVRNSPVLAADRITAPVLLLSADRDYVPPAQAEELFSALYRQQKDVVLVTYRGEGHVLSSPANIRDMYATVWAWLEVVLARGGADPAAGDRSRSWNGG